MLLLLAACQQKNVAATGQLPAQPPSKNLQAAAFPPPKPPEAITAPSRPHIAFLVPLEGEYGSVGQGLIESAHLAYDQLKDPPFDIRVYNVGTTLVSVTSAYKKASAEQPILIFGPFFAEEVKAIKATGPMTTPLISFSNDDSVAGAGVYNLGLRPVDQISALLDYVYTKGVKNKDLAAILPSTPYGHHIDDLLARLQSTAVPERIKIYWYDPKDEHLRKFAKSIPKINAKVIFLPEGQPMLSKILNALAYHNFDFKNVRFVGTALWDAGGFGNPTNTLTSAVNSHLKGAWYTSPDPNDRQAFEQEYLRVYNKKPLRFAALGYAAIEITRDLFNRNQPGQSFHDTLCLLPFSGVEGTLVFYNSGLNKRELAILEVNERSSIILDSGVKGVVSQMIVDQTRPVSQSNAYTQSK